MEAGKQISHELWYHSDAMRPSMCSEHTYNEVGRHDSDAWGISGPTAYVYRTRDLAKNI